MKIYEKLMKQAYEYKCNNGKSIPCFKLTYEEFHELFDACEVHNVVWGRNVKNTIKHGIYKNRKFMDIPIIIKEKNENN